ncbi:acyltransferase [Sphingomonas koreensis]|nr:acyltransferase [Sphingomonas koreensis]PJI89795.1 succinyltransferase-like protein [Sphingomonas koreensis]RSU61909.1 acyltransferase [Sphingomonas koreensis]RSU70563.1 acyltransferase [Sphingomonas koreensis]
MKALIKAAVRRTVDAVPFLRRRRDWGYGFIEWRVLLVNFLFQRIFRINGEAPWSVAFTSRVIQPHNVTIGRNVGKSLAVSGCCYIQAINGIEIGDDTIFSFGVGIVSSNHEPGNLSESVKDAPVRIGMNCWLGKNAIVLPGVELGDGCVVAAGAVVTRSFPPGTVVAGVPARPIEKREAAS